MPKILGNRVTTEVPDLSEMLPEPPHLQEAPICCIEKIEGQKAGEKSFHAC